MRRYIINPILKRMKKPLPLLPAVISLAKPMAMVTCPSQIRNRKLPDSKIKASDEKTGHSQKVFMKNIGLITQNPSEKAPQQVKNVLQYHFIGNKLVYLWNEIHFKHHIVNNGYEHTNHFQFQ